MGITVGTMRGKDELRYWLHRTISVKFRTSIMAVSKSTSRKGAGIRQRFRLRRLYVGRTTKFLSLSVLLLHVVFGCCLHRAHAEDFNCRETRAATGIADTCCANNLRDQHGHHQDGACRGKSVQAGHPCLHHRQCEGDRCLYWQATPRISLPAGGKTTIAPVSALLPTASLSRGTGQSTITSLDSSGPPLRPHLLYQVLLL